jgi:hypothetical protein
MRTWGFSKVDECWHAIDEQRGAFKTLCGRLLPTDAPLLDTFGA